jgi:hypothetical protein
MLRTFRPLAAVVAIAAILALANPSAAQKPFNDPVLDRMQKDVFFLASPECEGRGIETKGIQKAADYIAAAFQKAGLKPAMKDGSYFQPFDTLLDPDSVAPTALTLTSENAKKKLRFDTDFVVMGVTRTTAEVKGELVFAGYGITAPKLKYDDYADLDVEGKVVVVLRRSPRYGEKGDKRFDTTVPDGMDSPHAGFAAKIALAQKNKAAALVIVNDATAAAGDVDPLPKFGDFLKGFPVSKIPVLFLKRAALDDLLTAAKQKSVKELEVAMSEKLKPQTFELKGRSAEIVVTIKRPAVPSKNVVGVLEGAGPLKDETVVIGAHYDHVGYGQRNSSLGAAGAGKIHYGADDNASGTAGLMELARRFGAQKDRQGRRLVFIAFSGEEDGLQGSVAYCKNPLFPLAKTVGMLNMDMIGRTRPVQADFLGLFGKKDCLAIYGTGTGEGFDKLAEEAARKADFRLFKVAAAGEMSDHYSFYLKNVPTLFLFTGSHAEYHRPTDIPEKIDVPGMKRATDVAEMLTADLVTRDTAPKFAKVASGAPFDPTRPQRERKTSGTGPRLGILPSYTYAGTGVLLENVAPNGVAEKAGLMGGDVIVSVAGEDTPDVYAYMDAMAGQKPGTTIEIVVERKGKKLTLKAELK